MLSPRQKAKKFFKDLKRNEDATIRRVVNGARTAAANVMNDLAERGPEYSGIFKDSWRAQGVGSASGSGSRSGEYPYSRIDVPQLLPTRMVGFDVLRGKLIIRIFNTQTDYVMQALDLERGKFRPDMFSDGRPIPPIGKVVKQGARGNETIFRGEFVGPGIGKSTAKANWYTTYVKGGAFKKAVRKGVNTAYKPL